MEQHQDMGKSSLVLLCCIHLMAMDNARAQSPGKTTFIYGLDQGSHLKTPKYSTDNYMLQVASFQKHANAVLFKNELTKQIDSPVYIEPVKRVPITYRVVIGPIPNASSVVNISHQLLANIAKIKTNQLAANKKIQLKEKKTAKTKLARFSTVKYPRNSNKYTLQVKALVKAKISDKKMTIYGLEQGSHLKIPKHSSTSYMLQVASFEKEANAVLFKNQLAQRTQEPIQIIKRGQLTYRVVIGPITEAGAVVSLSNELLANKSHSALAKNSTAKSYAKTLAQNIGRKPNRNKFKKHLAGTQFAKKEELNPQTLSDAQIEDDKYFSLLTGFVANNEASPSLLEALAPDDQSIYQTLLTASANNIEAALNNQTSPEKDQQQVSSLPDSYINPLTTNFSKNHEEEQNWQKNLFLALADEGLRTEPWSISRKRKSPDLAMPLSRELPRENTSEPTKSYYFSLFEKNSQKEKDYEKLSTRLAFESKSYKPLMQLAVATEVPTTINMPSFTDVQAVEDKITYTRNGKPVEIVLSHYDPNVFALAYDVFIMNDSIGYAYRIAYTAVQHEPNSVIWREKLVQAALWAGNSQVALDQWMYFIEHGITPEKYIPHALTLAKQIGNYDARAQIYQYLLQKSPQNKELLLNYQASLQSSGFPGKAYKFLQDLPNAETDPQYLEQFILITKGTDQPDKEFAYLQKLIAIDPKNINARLEQAKKLYERGDLEGSFKVFSETASLIGSNHLSFWLNYAQIALLTGNAKVAIQIFQKLFAENLLDASSTLQLIQFHSLGDQLNVAYQYALRGYKKFPDLRFIKEVVSLGMELKKWCEIKDFISSLSTQNYNKLNNIPEYAMSIAELNRRVGLTLEAFENWSRILKLWPNLAIVQQGYLWYLIDNHEIRQMEYILKRWCRILIANPEFWEVYSAALSDIGDNTSALFIAKPHWEQINQDYAKLLATADLFGQNDNFFAQYYLKRRAFYLLLNEICENPKKITTRQYLALAELVRTFAPASVTYNVLLKISKDLFIQPEVDHQIVAWALENNNYSLSRYIIRAHKLTGSYTPPWMLLTLAMEEKDRDMIHFLLLDSPNLLPHRDRVTAANQIGHYTLAETFAYQGLKEHPFDSLMYDLFQETMLLRADKLTIAEYDEGWGVVTGPVTQASFRHYITPSISLKPYTDIWVPRTHNSLVIARIPSYDAKVGIAGRKLISDGWVELDVGERKALDRFYPVIGKWHRDNLFVRLGADLRLAYHDRADETTTLILGGMKDEVRLGFNYDSKGYNLYSAEISINRYLGQDELYLGSGEIFRIHWQHKLYRSYPDWNINFYGNALNFQTKNRALTPLLTRLVPPDLEPNSSFYIPQSDINGAITVGFGQGFLGFTHHHFIEDNSYSYKFRPFMEAGLIFSQILGFGQIVQGGFATSIFGRDRLVLFGEYSVNQQQVSNQFALNEDGRPLNQSQDSQVYYNIGMSYDYYF